MIRGGRKDAMVMRLMQRAMTGVMRRPSGVKSFACELSRAGGLARRADGGLQVVPTDQVIGSVGRWRELRADFTFATWPRLTERHARIARAMRAGATLPPLELYALVTEPALRHRLGFCGYQAYQRHWTAEAHLEQYFAIIRAATRTGTVCPQADTPRSQPGSACPTSDTC